MRADVPNHRAIVDVDELRNAQQVRPSMGSWLTHGLGSENQNLPGFIAMCPAIRFKIAKLAMRISAGSFQARMWTRARNVEELIAHIRNPRLSLEQQRRQLDLFRRINERHARRAKMNRNWRRASIPSNWPTTCKWRQAMPLIFASRRMCASVMAKPIARQILIARRLVERGVVMCRCGTGILSPGITTTIWRFAIASWLRNAIRR